MKKLSNLLCTLLALMLLTCSALADVPTADRAGNAIQLPEKVERIVCLAPATAQILESLNLMDKVVGVDNQTPLYVNGTDDLPQFDVMAPDVESIAMLEPDLVFTTGMSYLDGNPFALLTQLNICVVDIPSSNSLQAVYDDIVFTAACVHQEEAGKAIADEMMEKINELAAIGATIEEKKTVMFEIGAMPWLYSFGSGVYLDEMITLLGGVNVLGQQEGWIMVSAEDAVAANPDVILTSVNYIEDAVGEIMAREGWKDVTAVKNGDVYYIDNTASSQPNHHLVQAMTEMALALYPDAFGAYAE